MKITDRLFALCVTYVVSMAANVPTRVLPPNVSVSLAAGPRSQDAKIVAFARVVQMNFG